jgi:hypothetical protein
MSINSSPFKPNTTMEWRPKIVDRLYTFLPNDVIRMVLTYLSPVDMRKLIAGLSRTWYYDFYLDDKLW